MADRRFPPAIARAAGERAAAAALGGAARPGTAGGEATAAATPGASEICRRMAASTDETAWIVPFPRLSAAFAMVAATGNIYSGLWYPIVIAGMTLVVGLFLMPETKDRDIYADD